jgi:hypothetical protein
MSELMWTFPIHPRKDNDGASLGVGTEAAKGCEPLLLARMPASSQAATISIR